ncbi:hypothetical protein P879_08817 [Paragonimus westermani]|uniref:Selenoprotein W-related protein n=1 Tax=Paragonimus westermani TaxID=34504 RepID=A0A8T0DC03_9TREM|nr:hypothetical protein P879_08817 [Paragonimus westermani]
MVQKGRATSFEVTVDSILIFSKLQSGRFPDHTAITKQVSAVAEGMKPTFVTEYESQAPWSCQLL